MKTVLVADYGASAVRIIRGCQDAGLRAVALCTDSDLTAQHVRMADDAVQVTMVAPQTLLNAARLTGADTVHPGSSPIAADLDIASAIAESGLTWVGAAPDTIRRLGERVARQPADGDRVICVQVAADADDTVILGDQDASLRRRGEAIVVEAPAHGISDDLRDRLHHGAREEASRLQLRGLAELVYAVTPDGSLRLLSVTPGLPANFALTEAVTGVDLVTEQLRIADGRGISRGASRQPAARGLLLRMLAEDAGRGFLPSNGQLTKLVPPGGPGMRWDDAAQEGDPTGGLRGSLIALLTVTAADRQTVIRRARRAVDETAVAGAASTLPMARALLADEDFLHGRFSSTWLERHLMPQVAVQPRSSSRVRGEP